MAQPLTEPVTRAPAAKTRPFRFGVMLSERFAPEYHLPRDRAAWADTARRLEDEGYATVFLVDHFHSTYAPLVALMAAAAATTTLRIGTLVLAVDFRNPMVLAKDAATLDFLSGGRLEIGLGAGWDATDYRTAGIPFDPPATRIERLEELAELLPRLLAGEATIYAGRHFTVDAPAGVALAQQRPHPPVLIGGGGHRVLSLAARCAEIVGVNFTIGGGAFSKANLETTSAAATRERIAWIRRAAGARFDGLELNVTPLAVVAESKVSAAEELARRLGLSPGHVLESPFFLCGPAEQIVDDLEARRAEFGFSYVVFTGGHERQLADVVARLAGT
jgi:probable F420-dependent oxidoreductase